MTDTTAKKTLDDYLDAALEGGEKMVTLPTALLLALWSDASGGVAAAREVVANWSGGDLAGAVNNLEEWADAMVETYADMEESTDEEDDEEEPAVQGDDFDADPAAYDAKNAAMKPSGDPLHEGEGGPVTRC